MIKKKLFFLTNVLHKACNILGQVWYLIVSFSDLCRLSYFAQSDLWLYISYTYNKRAILYKELVVRDHRNREAILLSDPSLTPSLS